MTRHLWSREGIWVAQDDFSHHHHDESRRVDSLEEGEASRKCSLARQNMSVTCWLGHRYLKTDVPCLGVEFAFHALVQCSPQQAFCFVPSLYVQFSKCPSRHHPSISLSTVNSRTAPPSPVGDNPGATPNGHIMGPLSTSTLSSLVWPHWSACDFSRCCGCGL